MQSVSIPVRFSQELLKDGIRKISYDSSNLPNNPTEIIHFLLEEDVALKYYLDISLLYYHKGDTTSFKELLQAGCDSVKGKEHYKGQNEQHVAIFACLAAYYLELGQREKDIKRADSTYSHADQILMEADQIESGHSLVSLVKGLSILMRSTESMDIVRSGQHFDLVLGRDPLNIAALLGQACVAYESQDYITSLLNYQKVLRLWPQSPPDVRMGMGLSFFKLGNDIYAKKCFERVLSLDPTNINALVCCAVLDLNALDLNGALLKLRSAYKLDSNNPHVLIHLASHFFYKREYEKAEALAMAVYYAATNIYLKTESCFQLGKIYHIQNNLEEAFRFYLQATRLNPKYLPAQYCLGQIYLHLSDYQKAMTCFEYVIKEDANNLEAKKLACVCAMLIPKEQKKAVSLVKNLYSLCPEDPDVLLLYASFIEQTNHDIACEVYSKLVKILEAKELPILTEIDNNLGVLYFKTRAMKNAEIYLDRALSSCRDSSKLTILFNFGRLYEENGEYEKAQQVYHSILRSDPSYIECHLRLGLISMSLHASFEATSDHFKDAIGLNEECKEAWALLGKLQFVNGALTPSRKNFERILSKLDKHDVYSLLSLGNLYISLARHEKNTRTCETYNTRAAEFFQKCLMLDSRNMYAVNGLAILLAYKGHYSEAREAFLLLRQSSDDPIFSVNLAHTYLDDKHYAAALNIYEQAEKRMDQVLSHSINPISLGLYAAKSLFHLGKTAGREPSFFVRCSQYLQKLLILQPGDLALRYNLALSQQEYAASVLSSDKSNRPFELVALAIRALDVASLGFDVLADMQQNIMPQYDAGDPNNINFSNVKTLRTAVHLSFDPKMAKHRAKYCLSLRSSAIAEYKKQKEIDEERELRLDRLRKIREAEEQEAEKRAADELTLKLEEQARLDALYDEMQRKSREAMAKVASSVEQTGDHDSQESSTEKPALKKSGKRITRRKKADDLIAQAEDLTDDMNQNPGEISTLHLNLSRDGGNISEESDILIEPLLVADYDHRSTTISDHDPTAHPSLQQDILKTNEIVSSARTPENTYSVQYEDFLTEQALNGDPEDVASQVKLQKSSDS